MITVPSKTEYVIKTLTENGFEAYIVGGCVRDMLIGKTPIDYDVTTSATPTEIIGLFEKTIPTGIKHGTVTVIIDGEPIEVTTFRLDIDYKDGRHPDNVKFVKSLKQDLARRDFTVNAMAYNTDCGLKDYFCGINDLENKILRAVGNPEKRFSEDALRILRLFRFSSVLGFKIEENTLKYALLLSQNLQKISRERIAVELKKSVMGDNLIAFKPLIECGGLAFLGIKKVPDFSVISSLPKALNLRLFAFLKLTGCDIESIAKTLKLSNDFEAYFKTLNRLSGSTLPKTKPQLKRCLYISENLETAFDYLAFMNALGKNTANLYNWLSKIKSDNEPFLISHLDIDGNELKALGYSGKDIGKKLETLLFAVMDEKITNEKESLKNYLINL